jgi:hypothetical protein
MEDFLDLFISYICAKCGPVFYPHVDLYYHRYGDINIYLTPIKKLEMKWYENYFDDVEHGLFHGICSCYIAYLLNDQKIDEKTLASILLHDFLKSNGISQELHDKELSLFYANLIPETYSHSNPGNENDILVRSDRIELTRYDDHKEWVDDRYYNTYNCDIKDTLDKFYNEIRPCLLYFYKNRKDIFIRRDASDAGSGYIVEIDRIPFGYEDLDVIEQHGYCSNHGLGFSQNVIKYFMSLRDFNNLGGSIDIKSQIGNFIARLDVVEDNWYTVYQKIKEDHPHLKKFKNKIDQGLLLKFFTLVKILQDRLVVLNCVV